MNCPCHSLSPRKLGTTCCSSLQSDQPSAPCTRTRSVPRCRGTSGANGQLTRTDASPSRCELAVVEPSFHSSSAAYWRHPGTSDTVTHDTRGAATGTYVPAWYSSRTESTTLGMTLSFRWCTCERMEANQPLTAPDVIPATIWRL